MRVSDILRHFLRRELSKQRRRMHIDSAFRLRCLLSSRRRKCRSISLTRICSSLLLRWSRTRCNSISLTNRLSILNKRRIMRNGRELQPTGRNKREHPNLRHLVRDQRSRRLLQMRVSDILRHFLRRELSNPLVAPSGLQLSAIAHDTPLIEYGKPIGKADAIEATHWAQQAGTS
jgi:hypothetical protein